MRHQTHQSRGPDFRHLDFHPEEELYYQYQILNTEASCGHTANEDLYVFRAVGDLDADIKHNRIAVSSPISRALIGREIGDVVVVRAPAGDREYEIVDVEYL